jgi:ribosome-binding protein aMBF1 (putative translation factor)
MKTVHCSICGQEIKGSNFLVRMKKLREHRKLKHPKAHKKSVEKSQETKAKKKYDPVEVRKGLIANPRVESYADFQTTERVGSLIRVLNRANDTQFPELAMYLANTAPKADPGRLSEVLQEAGFTKETRSKHVLRTNKFTIFVYL